jgi:hypothetical protein
MRDAGEGDHGRLLATNPVGVPARCHLGETAIVGTRRQRTRPCDWWEAPAGEVRPSGPSQPALQFLYDQF